MVQFDAQVIDGSGESTRARRSVPVDSNPVLELSIAEDLKPIAPGELLAYTLTYGNRTQATSALNTVLSLPVPAGTTFVSADCNGTLTGDTVEWSVGDVVPGEGGQQQLVVQVDGAAVEGQVVKAEASISDSASPANLTRDNAVNRAKDLAPLTLSVVSDPENSLPGDTLSVNYTVNNTTTLDRAGIVLQAVVPEYVNSFSETLVTNGGTCPGTTCEPREIITWNLGILPANASDTVSIPPVISSGGSAPPLGTLIRLFALVEDPTGAQSPSEDFVLVGACTSSILPAGQSFDSNGGTGSVSVFDPCGLGWTALSNVSWITITSGSSGTCDGTVNYSVSANAGDFSRTGTITIAGETFTVTQDGISTSCTFSISHTNKSFGSGSGSDSVSVTAPDGCGWTATSNDLWITISSGNSGSGNGTVNYSVSANASDFSRTGTITIAGETFTVTQDGISTSCTSSISPTNKSFGSGSGSDSVSVTAPDGCGWTATSNDSWITISSGNSGSGNGTVNYSVSSNTSAGSRTGTMTIAGKTITITQEGISTVGPTPDIKANGSDGQITIGTNDTLTIAISLSSGSFSDVPADWWIVVNTPSGWQYYDLSQRDYTPGLMPTLPGFPLVDILVLM